MQYIDSTFNLKLDSMIDNVLEFKVKGENNNYRSLEVVKLLKTESISSHRFPDGEAWRKASKNSFGSKNTDKKTILELLNTGKVEFDKPHRLVNIVSDN